MRFHLEQGLPATVPVVLAAFLDPGFLATLGELPSIAEPELLEQRPEHPLVHQRVRYRFTGDLPAPARAVLDPATLVWVAETSYDLDEARAAFRILPVHDARLRCAGTYRFEPVGDAATKRVVDGELQVRYPLVGRVVERAILSGLAEHLDAEAQLVARWLQRRE